METIETTYLVKAFTFGAVSDEPFADLANANHAFDVLEHRYYSDEPGPVHSAYLYAVTGEKRVMLRCFDRAYDDYLLVASEERYKCIYCGIRSDSGDGAGFYCYDGPRGEHRYEEVDGDE